MRVILILMLIVPFLSLAQKEYQLHVEIKDTFEVAYREYFNGWVQEGFLFKQGYSKDSIGLDRVIIKRFFYYDCIQTKEHGFRFTTVDCSGRKTIHDSYVEECTKVYLQHEEKTYPNGCRSEFMGYRKFSHDDEPER